MSEFIQISCDPIIGYKIFQSDWSCHKYQYQMDKVNVYEGPIVITQSGFHFCPRALDCLHYYQPDSRYKYAKVRGSNQIIIQDDKCVTDHLEILEEISHKDFMKLCTGQLITYYQPNGTETRVQKTQITYRDGIKFGPASEWSANGKIKTKSYYVKGQLHGLIEIYNGLGKLITYKFYVKGKLKHTWAVNGDMVSVGYDHVRQWQYNGCMELKNFIIYFHANYSSHLKYTSTD